MTTTQRPATHLVTTNPHGTDALHVHVAATPEAEAAALAFLARHMPPYTGGSDYRVFTVEDVADGHGEAFIERLFPTCEHGMDAALCMGPDHFPSAQQERDLWG